jgi:hypothetical protein
VLLSSFLRTYGTKGLEHGLQQAVDAAIDNNWRRDPVDRRSRGALPHDASNPDSRADALSSPRKPEACRGNETLIARCCTHRGAGVCGGAEPRRRHVHRAGGVFGHPVRRR